MGHVSIDEVSRDSKLPVPVPGDAMLHPATMAALLLLLVNDHVLKAAFPGAITGKLSDVAGLAFFPTLLWSLGELALAWVKRPWGPQRRGLWGCVALTAGFFALAKTCAPVAAWYRAGVATLQWPFHAAVAALSQRPLPGIGDVAFVVDPTDLVALPAVLLPLWAAARRCTSTR